MEKGNEEVKEEKKVTKKKATTKKKTTKKTKSKAKKQTVRKTDVRKAKKKAELKEKINENLKGLEEKEREEVEAFFKNKAGQPRKYETEEELQEVINDYFRSCMKPVYQRGRPVRDPISGDFIFEIVKPFTMSGLAEALDMSRQTLLNYSNDEKFFDTIERARRKIERFAEEKLFEKETCNGSKFSLSNNFGWAEKNKTILEAEKLEDII